MEIVVEIQMCEGCDTPLDTLSLVGGYSVCMPCTKARHKAVLSRKCSCGKATQEKLCQVGKHGRKWISCLRCLGTVRQVS